MSKNPFGRVITVVNEPWGRSTIYDVDDDKSIVLTQTPTKTFEPITVTVDRSPSDEIKSVPKIPQESLAAVEEKKYELPYFMSCLFATILEDNITEIRILTECNTEMRITKTMSDMAALLAKKYGVAPPATVDELDGIDPNRLNCDEYKLNKLDADRKYLTNVLITTYEDLSTRQQYRALVDHVNKILDLDHYRAALFEDEAKNRMFVSYFDILATVQGAKRRSLPDVRTYEVTSK